RLQNTKPLAQKKDYDLFKDVHRELTVEDQTDDDECYSTVREAVQGHMPRLSAQQILLDKTLKSAYLDADSDDAAISRAADTLNKHEILQKMNNFEQSYHLTQMSGLPNVIKDKYYELLAGSQDTISTYKVVQPNNVKFEHLAEAFEQYRQDQILYLANEISRMEKDKDEDVGLLAKRQEEVKKAEKTLEETEKDKDNYDQLIKDLKTRKEEVKSTQRQIKGLDTAIIETQDSIELLELAFPGGQGKNRIIIGNGELSDSNQYRNDPSARLADFFDRIPIPLSTTNSIDEADEALKLELEPKISDNIMAIKFDITAPNMFRAKDHLLNHLPIPVREEKNIIFLHAPTRPSVTNVYFRCNVVSYYAILQLPDSWVPLRRTIATAGVGGEVKVLSHLKFCPFCHKSDHTRFECTKGPCNHCKMENHSAKACKFRIQQKLNVAAAKKQSLQKKLSQKANELNATNIINPPTESLQAKPLPDYLKAHMDSDQFLDGKATSRQGRKQLQNEFAQSNQAKKDTAKNINKSGVKPHKSTVNVPSAQLPKSSVATRTRSKSQSQKDVPVTEKKTILRRPGSPITPSNQKPTEMIITSTTQKADRMLSAHAPKADTSESEKEELEALAQISKTHLKSQDSSERSTTQSNTINL
ncbi:uncharacterized protein J8A68_005277, partial [[Candida] subhashii]